MNKYILVIGALIISLTGVMLYLRESSQDLQSSKQVQNSSLEQKHFASGTVDSKVDIQPIAPVSNEINFEELWAEAMSVPSDRNLIMAEFRKLGGVIKDEALDKDIASIIRDRFNNDRSAFEKDLNSKGLTISDFKNQRHDQMVVLVMRSRITKGISDPEEQEMKMRDWLRGVMKSALPNSIDD